MDSIYILFILFMMTYLTTLYYTNFEGILAPLRFIRTDLHSTPYVTINDSFYTQNDCKELLHQINNSGLIVSNPLNDSFENTKGFLLQFINNSDLQLQFQQNNANFLYNVFTKIKNPKCTYISKILFKSFLYNLF